MLEVEKLFVGTDAGAAGECGPSMKDGGKSHPLLGRTVGRLKLVERIGSGGFGSVYRAEHKTLKSSFAVKILHLTHHDEGEMVARFQREAQTIAGLNHPNLVRVSDFGQLEDGYYYLVMEFLTGISVEDALQGTPNQEPCSFTAAQLRSLFSQSLQALHYIHRKGIVHRDVKPANLFLGQSEDHDEMVVKLIDFGIAGQEQGGNITRPGIVVGTPAYMSPEQVRGLQLADSCSDVYALGTVFYECLSGLPPFFGEDLDVILHHLHTPTPSLADRVPDVDWAPELEQLLQRMLSKKKEERPNDLLSLEQSWTEALEQQSQRTPDLQFPALRAEQRVALEAAPPSMLGSLLAPKNKEREQEPPVEPATLNEDQDTAASLPGTLSMGSSLRSVPVVDIAEELENTTESDEVWDETQTMVEKSQQTSLLGAASSMVVTASDERVDDELQSTLMDDALEETMLEESEALLETVLDDELPMVTIEEPVGAVECVDSLQLDCEVESKMADSSSLVVASTMQEPASKRGFHPAAGLLVFGLGVVCSALVLLWISSSTEKVSSLPKASQLQPHQNVPRRSRRASLPKEALPSRRLVVLHTAPSKAYVYREKDGLQFLGKTPLKLSGKPGATWKLSVRKAGYQSRRLLVHFKGPSPAKTIQVRLLKKTHP
ncbi:MAG: serine/threonine protein kinase [Deltaproteobacteria bacterium]|nr:MAG: serine/threonine protein kinase [Deltaproteobacteria bacterium]